jgi:hypothetical protein
MARDILGKLPKALDKRKANEKTFEMTPGG